MSFIYAEKYHEKGSGRESVRILCDTKVTPGKFASAHFSEIERTMVTKYGIVKSTICCPDLCISYAGNNTLCATELFRQLHDMDSFELEDVSTYALRIHQKTSSQDDIEFIVAYFLNDQVFIDCVKNGKLERDVLSAHIGSVDAFSVFQRIRLSSGQDAAKQTRIAFSNIVAGCQDETVGGRALEVTYDYHSNSFVYRWERSFHTSKPQIVTPGESITIYSSESDGGYQVEERYRLAAQSFKKKHARAQSLKRRTAFREYRVLWRNRCDYCTRYWLEELAVPPFQTWHFL